MPDAATEQVLLDHVRVDGEMVERFKGDLEQSVRRAREYGISWNRIAAALGMSRQAASERFG